MDRVISASNTKIKNLIVHALTPLTSQFFAQFYLGLTPQVKDELFDAFAIGNYIEKYCRSKQ